MAIYYISSIIITIIKNRIRKKKKKKKFEKSSSILFSQKIFQKRCSITSRIHTSFVPNSFVQDSRHCTRSGRGFRITTRRDSSSFYSPWLENGKAWKEAENLLRNRVNASHKLDGTSRVHKLQMIL